MRERVLVAGFAQVPKGTTIYEGQKAIGAILVINVKTDIIEKMTFTYLKSITNDFLEEMILGKSIIDDIDEIVRDIETYFLVTPKKATIQALLSARTKYIEEKPDLK